MPTPLRRMVLVGVCALASLAGAPAASADSPNFHNANASVASSTGALSVSFKETGLGNTLSTERVTLTVDAATAEYQCWNNGGHHPKAGNKETVQTSLTTSGDFPVRNGQTTGVISAGPPDPGSFTCPAGQSLFLMSVTYSGIFVTGSTGDTRQATPDPVSSGPIMILIA
jgi:hypothetical protein